MNCNVCGRRIKDKDAGFIRMGTVYCKRTACKNIAEARLMRARILALANETAEERSFV